MLDDECKQEEREMRVKRKISNSDGKRGSKGEDTFVVNCSHDNIINFLSTTKLKNNISSSNGSSLIDNSKK